MWRDPSQFHENGSAWESNSSVAVLKQWFLFHSCIKNYWMGGRPDFRVSRADSLSGMIQKAVRKSRLKMFPYIELQGLEFLALNHGETVNWSWDLGSWITCCHSKSTEICWALTLRPALSYVVHTHGPSPPFQWCCMMCAVTGVLPRSRNGSGACW